MAEVDTRPDSGLRAPVRWVNHHGAGMENARRLGEELYHPHRLRTLEPGRDVTLAANVVQAGPITVGTLGYSAPVRVDTDAFGDAYQVNLPLDSPMQTALGTTQVQMTRKRAAVYRPDLPTSFSGWRRPGRMLAVRIDKRRFESVANAYLGRPARTPVEVGSLMQVTEGDGRIWLDALRRLTLVSRKAACMTDPAAAKGFITRLADEVCLRLAIAAVPDEDWADDVPAPGDAVDRCLELMDGLPALDLGLKELAEYAGVSGRTLQLAFRRRMDTTPTRQLRSIRLDRVRDDLLDPALSELGVSEIALARGFRHPGRFAQEYRRRFGHLPSQERV